MTTTDTNSIEATIDELRKLAEEGLSKKLREELRNMPKNVQEALDYKIKNLPYKERNRLYDETQKNWHYEGFYVPLVGNDASKEGIKIIKRATYLTGRY